jgi:succinate dehydrogenase/fumarate reductase cytochrome b subunit
MAGNTQIDPNTEGGLFSFMHGLTGYFVAVGLLLTILAVLTTMAIQTQRANATNFYKLDADKLQMNSPENHKMWINQKN